MASDIDVCNMALSHLGDSATVASIDPPEGSAQAEHCARWYPIARNALLEMHDWSFATARVTLAAVDNPWPEWRYAYAVPSDAQSLLAVLAGDAQDDYTVNLINSETYYGTPIFGGATYTPMPFITETDANGSLVLYTNQANAMLRYTRVITDASKFSALFVLTLARLLASYLAGPVLKGTEGIQASQAQLQIAMKLVATAAVSDSNDQRQPVQPSVPWIVGR